ncbi:MAG: hypothetical protein AAGI68_09705 [Planctomycetota bacterium]
MVWNDNRLEFVGSPVLEDTRYGDGEANAKDHLFERAGREDAWMTFDMDERLKEKQTPRDAGAVIPEIDLPLGEEPLF